MTKQPEQPQPYTVVVFFPAEAPSETVNAFFDKVAEMAAEIPREGWDPFVFGQARDLLQVEHDCECCEPHVYLSTSCFHGDHRYCQRETGLLGNKTPAVCKFCTAPCVCLCHADKRPESVDG